MKSIHFFRSAVVAGCAVVALSPGPMVAAAFAQVAPSVTIAPTGTFDAGTGTATVSGDYSCGETEGFAFVEVVLQQDVGRVSTVSGSAFAEIEPCAPGVDGNWTATVTPSNGEFRGGPASASARLVVDDTGAAETSSSVRLRR